MQIVVNHLTRMRTDRRICVAGIDPSHGGHVRPVTPRSDPLTRDLLSENGGPLEVAALIEIGRAQPVPNPPEVEDHRIRARGLEQVRTLDDDEYLELLDRTAEPDLERAFGPALRRRNWKYAIDEGQGAASLAVIKARRRPQLSVGRYGRLEFRFNDPEVPTYLSVADVRFVESDHSTIRTDRVDDVQGRLTRGVGVYVMFGLSRAFPAVGDDRPRHWLQVNGLCLEDRPTGAAP